MLETLTSVLSEIFAADAFSYVVVAGLTALAAFMIRVTTSTALAIWFAPGMAFGGLAGIYAFRQIGYAFTSDSDSNVLLASAAGIVVGIGAMMALTRLIYALSETKKPVRALPARH